MFGNGSLLRGCFCFSPIEKVVSQAWYVVKQQIAAMTAAIPFLFFFFSFFKAKDFY